MNDENSYNRQLHNYRFFVTPEHECSYLADRQAVTLFVDPHAKLTTQAYSVFAGLGFRRSGEHVYRPHCKLCSECRSVRIDVERFQPSRSQIRILKRNQDIELNWLNTQYQQQHFELYQLYMRHRHHDSSMVSDTPEQYQHMIGTDWCDTRLGEYRLDNKLIAIAVTDWLQDGLSAVYTFFDPEYASYSLGTYSILKQIQTAKEQNKDYVYLGYWIKDCAKMSYKIRFSAIEIFNGHNWRLST